MPAVYGVRDARSHGAASPARTARERLDHELAALVKEYMPRTRDDGVCEPAIILPSGHGRPDPCERGASATDMPSVCEGRAYRAVHAFAYRKSHVY
jgi:hypothetical protein